LLTVLVPGESDYKILLEAGGIATPIKIEIGLTQHNLFATKAATRFKLFHLWQIKLRCQTIMLA